MASAQEHTDRATPHDKVLLLIGGAVVVASLCIGIVFIRTETASASLRTDGAAAREIQALGDDLLFEVHEQHEELAGYLMSADPGTLARYRQAVAAASDIGSEIRVRAERLDGVVDALATVTTENATWQATFATPAILASQAGDAEALDRAIQVRVHDPDTDHAATNDFVRQIDVVEAELAARSDVLDGLRVQATALGVAIELMAAGLALRFVRRFGLRISRDARRRGQASAERIAIIASLRTLRAQETPEATAAAIATAMLGLPGVDGAAVVEFVGDGAVALAVAGLPSLTAEAGGSLPESLARYLQERAMRGQWAMPFIAPPATSPEHEKARVLGIKSVAFAPIQTDGLLVGVLGIATTDEDLGRRFVEELPAVGEFASQAESILGPALLARREREQARQRIASTIAAKAFRPVFQPIVELATGRTVGYEALTRFDDGRRPDHVLADAALCGMGIELETVTLEAALGEAHRLALGTWLSVNVSPALLSEGGILRRILAPRMGLRVLEITEHETIEAYKPLREAMLRLGPGVRFAVDDAGAGVANFNHLVELRPNFVKIDIGLVRGVDADPGRRAVVVGLVHFAQEAGCEVIAEGIETEAERATVAELGVRLGQGYLLGAPAPAEAWGVQMGSLIAAPGPRPVRAAAPRHRSINRLHSLATPGPGQPGDVADRAWAASPMSDRDRIREDPGADIHSGAIVPAPAPQSWLPS